MQLVRQGEPQHQRVQQLPLPPPPPSLPRLGSCCPPEHEQHLCQVVDQRTVDIFGWVEWES